MSFKFLQRSYLNNPLQHIKNIVQLTLISFVACNVQLLHEWLRILTCKHYNYVCFEMSFQFEWILPCKTVITDDESEGDSAATFSNWNIRNKNRHNMHSTAINTHKKKFWKQLKNHWVMINCVSDSRHKSSYWRRWERKKWNNTYNMITAYMSAMQISKPSIITWITHTLTHTCNRRASTSQGTKLWKTGSCHVNTCKLWEWFLVREDPLNYSGTDPVQQHSTNKHDCLSAATRQSAAISTCCNFSYTTSEAFNIVLAQSL